MASANPSPADPRAAALSRRDRAVILLALLGVTGIAWLYLLTIGQGMAGMTDKDDRAPGCGMTFRFDMHLRNQRAGCVEIEELASLGFGKCVLDWNGKKSIDAIGDKPAKCGREKYKRE